MPRRLDGDDSGPAEPEQPTPYADGAPSVEQSGFGWPVPIPFGEKQPPPTGSTGKSGSVTHADVKAWTLSNDGDNIAVVLNHGVVGIDVDDYDGKGGGTTFAGLRRDLGPLPDTWYSTSRDGGSGILLFRVDPELSLPSELGAGIEVIQHDHRYVVCAPSRHPEGRTYVWRHSGSGDETDDCPTLDMLAELSPEWQTYLADMAVPDMHSESASASPNGDARDERDRRLSAALRVGRGSPGDLFNGALDTVEKVVEWLSDEPYRFHSPKGITVTTAAGLQEGALMAREGRPTGYKSLTVLAPSTGPWPSITVFSTDPAFIPETIRSGRQYDPFGFAAAWNGHDPSDPDELKTFAREMSNVQPETGETGDDLPDVDPTGRVDLAEVYEAGLSPAQARYLARRDGASLLYRGRTHVFYGQPEAGKSWLSLVAGAQEMTKVLTRLGGVFTFIDYEDTPAAFMHRLVSLGVPPDVILKRASYFKPPGPLTPEALRAMAGDLAASRIVVIDSRNEAMAAHGWDPLNNKEVALWRQAVLNPIIEIAPNAALVVIDHEGKSMDGTALGGQMKRAGITGAEYLVRVVEQPSPGVRGVLAVYVTKDREGSVRKVAAPAKEGSQRQHIANLVLDPQSATETATNQAGAKVPVGTIKATLFAPVGTTSDHQVDLEAADAIVVAVRKLRADGRTPASQKTVKTVARSAGIKRNDTALGETVEWLNDEGWIVPTQVRGHDAWDLGPKALADDETSPSDDPGADDGENGGDE